MQNVLSFHCSRVLYEGMLLPVLIFNSKTVIWNKGYRPNLQSVQMDVTKELPRIKFKELCGAKEIANEEINAISLIKMFFSYRKD